MTKIKFSVLIIAVPFTASVLAGGEAFTPEKLSGSISTGLLSGEAKGKAYNPEAGGQIKQLKWKYKNAAIIKGNIDWDLFPWVSLGASGWTTYASRSAHLDDYKWKEVKQNKSTDYPSSPSSKLNYANYYDLNIKGWILNEPDYRLGLMLGYQQSAFSWTAKSRGYNYNHGTDPGMLKSGSSGPANKQKIGFLYVGLTGFYRYDKWEVNGAFKLNTWGKASDNDEQYSKNAKFISDGSSLKYYSLAADVGYYVTDNAKVYIEGTWNRMRNAKGNVTLHDYANVKKNIPGVAGIENNYYMVTAGLRYTF